MSIEIIFFFAFQLSDLLVLLPNLKFSHTFSILIVVVWVVMLCCLAGVYQHFEGMYCQQQHLTK
jgi:hypothetical protein